LNYRNTICAEIGNEGRRKKVKLWWIANVFWVVVFSILSIIIATRQIDGSGAVQTPEIRIITFIILAVPFVFILIVQLIWFYFIHKRTRHS